MDKQEEAHPEEASSGSTGDGPVFHLRHKDCGGSGVLLPDGQFRVFAGAHGRPGAAEKLEADRPKRAGIRRELIGKGILREENDRLELTQDYTFENPTHAASILYGSRVNGWVKWKDDEGRIVRELRDARRSSGSSSGAYAGDNGSPPLIEIEFRQMWHEVNYARMRADEEAYQGHLGYMDFLESSGPEFVEAIDNLGSTGNLDSFHELIKERARPLGFMAHSGILFINQLVKLSEDPQQFAALLAEALTIPDSDDAAVAKIQSMVDYARVIGKDANLAPGATPFFLSFFWSLADRERWPAFWARSYRYIEFHTGEWLPSDPVERYMTFLKRVKELEDDLVTFEMTGRYWDSEKPVFIDEVVFDRIDFGFSDRDDMTGEDGQADIEGLPYAEKLANAKALVSIGRHWGKQLEERVSAALSREMKVTIAPLMWLEDYPRPDLWVDWRPKGTNTGLSIRVWVNEKGVAVALRPGVRPAGWWDKVKPILETANYPGCQVLGGKSSDIGEDVGFFGKPGEFVYGRWFDRDEVGGIDLPATVSEVAEQLKPLFDELMVLAGADEPAEEDAEDGPDPDDGESETGTLDELAQDLLVDPAFLKDIVKLLEDKGQVVLYGPPGTGKTYLARELADFLGAADPSRRKLVQFHPSSSYEDFFEGYRPVTDDGGNMTYQLTEGPLVRLAEEARKHPNHQYVMIIDEINRANLPKVLGELLFLLEYRDETVQTLYRPDSEFRLPKNLWFIGTMNTADRSIALVDAALRRRFHFVPFFPNQGPTEGLLERWLEENKEPEWVGEFLAKINHELERDLGGSHLLIGPSHFMKKGLNKETVERIWKYNIEPFIEDQFFGNRDQIAYFRFDTAYDRFLDQSGRRELAELEAEFEDSGEENPEP